MFSPIRRCSSASGMSVKTPPLPIPALSASASTGLPVAAIAATSRSAPSGVARLAATSWTVVPCSANSPAVASRPASSEVISTSKPRVANWRASSRPIPLVAPVTTANGLESDTVFLPPARGRRGLRAVALALLPGGAGPNRTSCRASFSPRSGGRPRSGAGRRAARSRPRPRAGPGGVRAAPRAGRTGPPRTPRPTQVTGHRAGQFGGAPQGRTGRAAQPGEPERVPDARGRAAGSGRGPWRPGGGRSPRAGSRANGRGRPGRRRAAPPRRRATAGARSRPPPGTLGPQHRGAGHDAEQRGPGQAGAAGQREPASSGVIGSSVHHGSTTIRAVTDGDVRVGVQGVGGQGERARLPPGVVVAEGDVRGGDLAQGQVAADRAEVGAGRDQLDVWVTPADLGRGPVGRAVVDHDDGRVLRHFLELVQGAAQLGRRLQVMTTTVTRGEMVRWPAGGSSARVPSRRRMSASTGAGRGRRRSRARGRRQAFRPGPGRPPGRAAGGRARRAVSARARGSGRRSQPTRARLRSSWVRRRLASRAADGQWCTTMSGGRDRPAQGGQIVGQQLFLAADAQHPGVAADGQVGVAPSHGGATQEAEHARAGQRSRRQRTGGQNLVDRIGHRLLPHHGGPGDQADLGPYRAPSRRGSARPAPTRSRRRSGPRTGCGPGARRGCGRWPPGCGAGPPARRPGTRAGPPRRCRR